MTVFPAHSFLRKQVTAVLLTALTTTSLIHVSAYAGSPENEEETFTNLSESTASESSAVQQIRTLRDAKGNRIQLLTKDAAAAAAAKPDLWSQLDLQDDKVPGTSTNKAYKELNLKAPAEPIIVAVLDSGLDINQPDLKGMIWTNEKEAAGPAGQDNDGDGYFGDIHGWNFLGGKDGTNVGPTTLEVAREYKRMKKKASTAVGRLLMSKKNKAYLAELETEYNAKKKKADADFAEDSTAQKSYMDALAVLKKLGLKDETAAEVAKIKTRSADAAAAKKLVADSLLQGKDSTILAKYVDADQTVLNFNLSLTFDSSTIVGDNPKNLTEKYYGNADVRGLGAEHGTHCSGIIGALRNNGIGPDGQSNWVKIMPIRAVPDGDERDKDIANGIRFAVDHGARIISMSFGKDFSPGKKLVDAAVAYAGEKNVLLVHAAGNDSANLETAHNFPTAKMLKGDVAPNWIEVGASTKSGDEYLPATFSNYGAKTVDLFAPGSKIYSTTPDGTYSVYSGTSMATPEVAGVAALVLSQKPTLTAVELKKILTSTVTTFGNLEVNLPSKVKATPENPATKIPFSELSNTGGVVNAYNALKAL
jgi:cell wall-associated protease